MRTKRAGVNAVLTQIEQGSDRSSLFYWMVKHHDEMAGKAKGRRLRWAELCITFKGLGLTNQHGEVASERTARETWYQARRHVASDRANSASLAATGIVRRHSTVSVPSRSRAPSSWQPEQIQAQSIPNKAAAPSLGQPRPPQSSPHDSSSDTSSGVEGRVSDDVVKARMAAIRRELDKRSGR